MAPGSAHLQPVVNYLVLCDVTWGRRNLKTPPPYHGGADAWCGGGENVQGNSPVLPRNYTKQMFNGLAQQRHDLRSRLLLPNRSEWGVSGVFKPVLRVIALARP